MFKKKKITEKVLHSYGNYIFFYLNTNNETHTTTHLIQILVVSLRETHLF